MLVHVWAILLLGAAQFLPPIHAMKKNKNDEVGRAYSCGILGAAIEELVVRCWAAKVQGHV